MSGEFSRVSGLIGTKEKKKQFVEKEYVVVFITCGRGFPSRVGQMKINK